MKDEWWQSCVFLVYMTVGVSLYIKFIKFYKDKFDI